MPDDSESEEPAEPKDSDAASAKKDPPPRHDQIQYSAEQHPIDPVDAKLLADILENIDNPISQHEEEMQLLKSRESNDVQAQRDRERGKSHIGDLEGGLGVYVTLPDGTEVEASSDHVYWGDKTGEFRPGINNPLGRAWEKIGWVGAGLGLVGLVAFLIFMMNSQSQNT